MRLHGYILRQILWPVLAALVVLNGLFLAIQLLKVGEVTFAAGLGLSDLLTLAIHFLPGFALLTVPVAVLTGVLLGFGRLAEDEELVALAAAGVAPARLAWVPLGLGFAAAGAAFCLGAWVAPASANALHRTFSDLAKRQVVASLVPGRFFEEIPRVVFYPHRAAGDAGGFDGFLLYDHRPGRARHALLARHARVRPAPDGHNLRLHLTDGEVHAREKKSGLYSVAAFEQADIAVDIDRLVRDRTRFLSPLARLDLDGLQARAAGGQGLDQRDRARASAAWHKRFAFPVACLIFALLGAALGGSGRLRGRRRTLVAAVAVVVAYYLFMRLADALVDGQAVPPAAAAWAPDFVFAGLVAWWMVRRGRRPTG